MLFCSFCGRKTRTYETNGAKLCCSRCGRVISEVKFSNKPTFVKNSNEQCHVSGTFVKTIQNESSVSERTLNKNLCITGKP